MEEGKGTVKRVLTVIGNVIIWLFVIFAAVITVLTFAAQSSEDGIPAIGSTAVLTVSSDSMKPVFEKGDIILGRKLTPEGQTSLKVGDVITFDAGDLDGDNIRDFNTHRIVEIEKDDAGRISYITKGDNVAIEDERPVDPRSVICKYTGKRLKGVGKVIAFLQTSKGFLFCVVLPLILLFIFELLKFVRKFLEVKGGKQKLSAEDEARIRQQAVEEYLRSQGGAVAASPVENVAEKPVTEPETPVAEESAAEEAPEEAAVEEAEEAPADEPEALEIETAEETPAEEPAEETTAEETTDETPEEAAADAPEEDA